MCLFQDSCSPTMSFGLEIEIKKKKVKRILYFLIFKVFHQVSDVSLVKSYLGFFFYKPIKKKRINLTLLCKNPTLVKLDKASSTDQASCSSFFFPLISLE